jgi:hypothetical protein
MPTCRNASSGHAATSWSAPGKRSRVRNAARPSATTVCQPSARASGTSARAMCTAPMTNSTGRRGKTSRNTAQLPPSGVGTSTVVLCSRRSAASAGARTASPSHASPGSASTVPVSSTVSEPPLPASPPVRVPTIVPPSPRAAARTRAETSPSTHTLIVPPHASPTDQAVSSLTPNVTSFGVPRAIASWISATVAPSTQPPETEPAIPPVAVARRQAPSGRGAEPHTLVTTARPTGAPVSRRRW